nr:hypothetical protein [Tanacetum cinerariifolium]
HQSNLKESHLIAVKRILGYLKGTSNLGLYYLKCSAFDLKRYSDSDYVGCNMDRYSTSDAKYVAATRCCASILWMKSQLGDYDIYYKMVPIFYDNTSAIAISNNPVFHSRTKHIDIRYHFIRDHILKGKYVAHPSPEVVKKELAKIITNASYLDKTPIPKNSFLMAWRILITFVIQVLGGNYSSTEQINFIQQMISYCLITRTEVDIGEIIYSDLITRLLNKTRDPSKVTDIELTGHMAAVNNQKESVSPLPFSKRKKALTNTKGKTYFEVNPGTKTLQLTTIADIQACLISNDELLQESDEEEIVARDDMDADPKADEEVQSLQPTKDKPESSLF